jgi:hypothetical protein
LCPDPLPRTALCRQMSPRLQSVLQSSPWAKLGSQEWRPAALSREAPPRRTSRDPLVRSQGSLLSPPAADCRLARVNAVFRRLCGPLMSPAVADCRRRCSRICSSGTGPRHSGDETNLPPTGPGTMVPADLEASSLPRVAQCRRHGHATGRACFPVEQSVSSVPQSPPGRRRPLAEREPAAACHARSRPPPRRESRLVLFPCPGSPSPCAMLAALANTPLTRR